MYVPTNYIEPETYTCKKCTFGNGGNEWLEKSLIKGISLVADENLDIMRKLTEIKIQIEKAENEDIKCGERENKLKDSMNEMNTSLAAKGALANHLQRRTTCKIQNGRRSL